MLKKVCICLMIGAIALTAAACTDKGTEKTSNTVTKNTAHEKKSEDIYKSIFKNSLFFGDSITEGLNYQELIDDTNVIADAGKVTVMALEEDVDKVVEKNPEHIFMSFGINDLLMPKGFAGNPLDNPVKFSIDNYSKLIQKVKEKLPNVKIHIISVTPVTDKALQEYPQYKHIDEYNAKLKELAKAEKAEYIDLSPIFDKDTNLHDEDGVHFKANYYTQLLDLLKNSVK
ncbi:GDSL-type esterase/lipase family protein [Lysinibacillus xylanilyticus]|uniref:GDSL-type esterase/lipase family protein n=1 Tax=Lysinibacillus xylanilyticus TaxID=582475 RepID=UPI002B24ABE6|nr:GDSL-type esterase/lipase family protein [Lysinibacillus xylanilyticus]MEB2299436.1 GDSL-type esterase/lipase family protein [Lysinibacillus xylanilyticus]